MCPSRVALSWRRWTCPDVCATFTFTTRSDPIFDAVVPLTRRMGAVDAGRKTAARVLKAGLSMAVYPGGSREIFSTDPNSTETKIYLKRRQGFIRLAMQHGADLVPVFIFGEKRCYKRLNVPASLRDWLLRVLKIPLIVFWGRWFTVRRRHVQTPSSRHQPDDTPRGKDHPLTHCRVRSRTLPAVVSFPREADVCVWRANPSRSGAEGRRAAERRGRGRAARQVHRRGGGAVRGAQGGGRVRAGGDA